jgi:outer membrane protein TolC
VRDRPEWSRRLPINPAHLSPWVLAALLAPFVVGHPAQGQEGAKTIAVVSDAGVPGSTPVLHSVGFREAVEAAMGRNPSALTAVQEIRRVAGLMEETRANSLPTLSVTATGTLYNKELTFNPGGDAGVVTVRGKSAFNVTGTLAIPIIAPQAWADWRRAADQIDVQKATQADVQRTVGINTARAYLTVFAQKRQVEVNRLARDNAKSHLDYSEARLRGGIGNKLDWARAGQQLESDEALLENSYANLYRTQEALGILLGVETPVDVQNVPELPEMPTLDQALAESSTRTDLFLFEEERRAADRSLNLSWTEYLPTITLTGQPFYQTPASLTSPNTGWQAQAVLTWFLYDGGARYGRTHQREAALEEARITLAAGLRQANSDVRTSVETFGRTTSAVERARNSARLANEAMRLAEIAYRAGATTNLELIDAQRQARDAETLANIAEDNARQAAIDLLAASGRFPAQLRRGGK